MNHSGIPQIHSNGEENSLSGEERLIKIFLSPLLFVRSLWSEKEIQTAQQVCFLQAWWNLQMNQGWKNFSVFSFFPQNVYEEGVETERLQGEACYWKESQKV